MDSICLTGPSVHLFDLLTTLSFLVPSSLDANDSATSLNLSGFVLPVDFPSSAYPLT